jgi:hypothetical protein
MRASSVAGVKQSSSPLLVPVVLVAVLVLSLTAAPSSDRMPIIAQVITHGLRAHWRTSPKRRARPRGLRVGAVGAGVGEGFASRWQHDPCTHTCTHPRTAGP